MLLAFPELYTKSLQARNELAHDCITLPREAAGSKAVLSLLDGMQSPLLSPNVNTFCAVANCLVAQLGHGVPAHHLVTQLHEFVLPKLHSQLGKGVFTAKVYVVVMRAFSRGDSVAQVQSFQAATLQLILLMAQNGIEGLSSEACNFLVEAIDGYNKSWVQDTFGTAFVIEVEDVYLGEKQLASPADVVSFQKLEAPMLHSRQLDTNLSYMDFKEGDLPDFMVPPDVWHTYKFVTQGLGRQYSRLHKQLSSI